MGAGKSKSKNYMTVELETDDGKVLSIDLDFDLIREIGKKYRDSILDYNMTPDELQNYADEKGVRVTYGWGLIDENLVSLDYDTNKASVNDSDIGYFIKTAIDTASTIDEAFKKASGSKYNTLERLYFDKHIEDYQNGVKGFEEKVLVDTGEYTMSEYWGRTAIEVYKSVITLETSPNESILSKRLIEKASKSDKQGLAKIDMKDPSSTAYIKEMLSSQSGWFAMSGSYSSTTVAHEMGHSIMDYLTGEGGTLYKNGGLKAPYSNKNVSLWFDRTRGDPVSGYSQKNKKEAFAECFSLYVYGGKSSSQMYKEFESMMKTMGLDSMKGCCR